MTRSVKWSRPLWQVGHKTSGSLKDKFKLKQLDIRHSGATCALRDGVENNWMLLLKFPTLDLLLEHQFDVHKKGYPQRDCWSYSSLDNLRKLKKFKALSPFQSLDRSWHLYCLLPREISRLSSPLVSSPWTIVFVFSFLPLWTFCSFTLPIHSIYNVHAHQARGLVWVDKRCVEISPGTVVLSVPIWKRIQKGNGGSAPSEPLIT